MTSVRGRRTVEVHPVQKGHFPRNFLHEDGSISDISNAWDNMNEAKRVLNRAEMRANEAAMPLSSPVHPKSANRRPPSYHWEITPTKDPVARVPGQESMSNYMNEREMQEYRRAKKSKQRTRYAHQGTSHHSDANFIAGRHGTDRDRVPLSPHAGASIDILGRGPTELTLDDRTEVRVLNDLPMVTDTLPDRDHTVEVSPGLKVNSDYIPAYDRLYGDHTGSTSRTTQGSSLSDDRRALPTALSLAQIEELRRRVDRQRAQSGHHRRPPENRMLHKSQHRESDPVVYQQNGEVDTTMGEYQLPDAVPVRKIAKAPPPPHYRGFNLPATHYALHSGRVANDGTTNSRQDRNRKHRPAGSPETGTGGTRTLQPSRTHCSNAQNQPSRKVHRKKASKKGKSSEEKAVAASKVSAYAWREGQKAVREALGPLRRKEKVPHSPPTKDGVPPGAGADGIDSSNTQMEHQRHDRRGGSDDEEEKIEQGDDNENRANLQRGKLSSEAKDVLRDLDLNSSGEDSDHEVREESKARRKERKPLSFIIEPRKPPLGKSIAANSDNLPTGEVKVRHYDSREVRRYMVQQKNKRKRKQQEADEEKREAEARKQKQLEELYRKQKESAGKPTGRNAPVPQTSSEKAGGKQPSLDQTYNTDPPSIVVNPRRTTGEGRQYPPRTQAMRRLDVTSSDKENKAFWTTSSSDTSSRSSPQTDIAGQTPQTGSHPANQAPTGGDIVLVPVTEEGAPISVVGRQRVTSPDQEVSTAKPTTPTTTMPNDEWSAENQDSSQQALVPTNLPVEPSRSDVGPSRSNVGPSRHDIAPPRTDVAPPRTDVEPSRHVVGPSRYAGGPSRHDIAPSRADITPLRTMVDSQRAKPSVVKRAQTSNEERLQALKETASALHSRLDSEVKKLAHSLRVPVPQSGTPVFRRGVQASPHQRPNLLNDLLQEQSQSPPPSSSRADRSLSPRHLTWHNQLEPPSEDRWAFSVPSSRPYPREWERQRQRSPYQTRHQRTIAMEEPNLIFRGSLPGIGSSNRHAREAYVYRRQDLAATKIQAAFRGHNVRQKMKWAAPGNPTQRNELPSDHMSLSEGMLSDDISVTAGEDYLPEFQSLQASPHRHSAEPTPYPVKPSPVSDIPQSISSMLLTPSAFEPTNDGLSVVDIYTRRYQQAQRSLLAPRTAADGPSRTTPPRTQPSHSAVYQPGSERREVGSRRREIARPTTLNYSDDDFHSVSNKTSDSVDSQRGRGPPLRAVSPYTLSRTDTSGLQAPDEGRVGTGSEVTVESRSQKSPTSSHSGTGTIDSISAALDSPPHPTTPQRSKREVITSPCSLPLSPTQDNLNKPSSRSPQSDPGHRGVRRSPLGSNAYSSSDDEAPRTVRSRKRRGRRSPSSKKSPSLSPDTPRNFRPITSPVVPPAVATSNTSPVSKPRPPAMPSMVGYSPGALQLKMASELNLLEMLDASSQQLAEMEHARTIALAHEESAALARVLQGRQLDYEHQLQLLNLKSRQEVEEAQRQLTDVRQGYADTALEAQRELVRSKQEAAEARRGEADRLLQTQAEASRITAEAARQLAEAQRAALAQPPPPPPIDVSKLTADSVHAGVSAALEQQRLQQQELLRDMRNGYKSPPPPRRSLGIGVSLPDRTSQSPLPPTRSPTPHYTEDFTHSSPSSQSPTKSPSVTQSRDRSISSITESIEHSASRTAPPTRISQHPQTHSSSSNSISDRLPDRPPVIRTTDDKSPPVVSSMYSLRSVESENDSSIHTDSEAKRTTMNDSESVSEIIQEAKSVSEENSVSFDHSNSEVESVVDTSERVAPSMDTAGSQDTRGNSERTPMTPVPATTLPDLSRATPSPPRLTADFIRQQLEEEEMRAQHQAALLNLREKALEDKTQAELQWLEYQKRQLKNGSDEDGLNLLRRKQRQLYARMTHEKEEIRLLREAQESAGRKLQRLIEEQENIARLQQSAQQSKARTQVIATPLTPHLTSFESLVSEDSVQRSPSPRERGMNSPTPQDRGKMSPLFGAATLSPELSPAEKQAKALQSAKLNARVLSKRQVSLRKRRREAEELLAWKQKLDQEEAEVKQLEDRVKARQKSPQPNSPTQESAPNNPVPSSEVTSRGSDRPESAPTVTSRGSDRPISAPSGGSTSKSRTRPVGSSSGVVKTSSRSRTSEGKSVPEEISAASTDIAEEIEGADSQSKSKKSPGLNSSGEETVKDVSQVNDYTSESFDSVDQSATQADTPSPVRNSLSVKSSPSLLSPRRRRRPEPESGSESERSLSQTFSETASDQSDVEGRIRALTDSLKKRKVEADKLRKQQKRHYREKLKAQEASLKKQLETYDAFIDQTRKELVKEKDSPHTSILLPGAKPQIKHQGISETQRRRDQSHTRALRQRTASDSSIEGTSHSVDISKKRGPGNKSNKTASSIEEEPTLSSPRDAKNEHEGEKRKSVEPTARSRSLSGESSMTEDISLRSLEDQSISDVSLSAKLKESLEEGDEGLNISDQNGTEQAGEPAATVSPDHEEVEEELDEGADRSDHQRHLENRPESSEIPEEMPSIVSGMSSISLPVQRLDLSKDDGESAAEDKAQSRDVSLKSSGEAEDKARSRDASVKSSGDARSSVAEEVQPQQSPRTESRTGSSKNHSSKRSPRTDPSYSEDFQESSVSIDIRESKSDTEDDISEHLSDRSTASGESQVSEKFVARPTADRSVEDVQEASVVVQNDEVDISDRSHHVEANELRSVSPEVTVSPTKPDEIDSEVMKDIQSAATTPGEIADPLPGLSLGARVDVDNYGSGVVQFKGPMSDRDGPWVGIELDQPNGFTDGTYAGTSYFSCPSSNGVFVRPDRVTDEVTKKGMQPSVVDEDLSNHSSIHTSIGGKAQDMSGASFKFPDDLHTGDFTDAESIVEEISEGITDDVALQKVIISTAEAVESFSFDDRDEPEGIESSPVATPRGPPPDEESSQSVEPRTPEPQLAERIADDLIREVIQESLRTVLDAVEKQRLHDEENKEDSSKKSTSLSFLELITQPEGEEDTSERPALIPDEENAPSKDQVVESQVNGVLKSLVAQAVEEMISLKESRNKKWNTEFSPTTSDRPVHLADLDKITTPHIVNGTGTNAQDDLDAPLPDDLFVNKVQVHSAISGIRDGDDATPRARPTSPIFGESGSISPQALCDKLEQLQALDQDIFGADIFGGQEWFDDEFGSMPKSNSIIKVPPRAVDEGMIPRSPSPEEPLPKYNEARNVELKRFVEEPFMAVPHNEKEVSTITEKAVDMVHHRAQVGESLSPLSPTLSILGSDTIGSDIESTSRKAYKKLVFDLAKETYQSVKEEQATVSNPPWMKPKLRPRRFLFKEPPETLEEMNTAVKSESLRVIGLGPRRVGEQTFNRYALKKKRDKVDEILIQELREEEQEWVDYDDDELSVKMQLSDAIFTSLLSETVSVIAEIGRGRLGRSQPAPQSDSDVEF